MEHSVVPLNEPPTPAKKVICTFSFSAGTSSSIGISSYSAVKERGPLTFIPNGFGSHPLNAYPFLGVTIGRSIFDNVAPSGRLTTPANLSERVPFSPTIKRTL